MISVYVVRFSFATMAIFLTRAESIQYLWFQIYRLGMRPDSIYHPWLRFAILTIIPVGSIASVPTSFLVHTQPRNVAVGDDMVSSTFVVE